MSSIREFLQRRMRLQVNEGKSGVRTPGEVHFLGFRFHCPTRESGNVAVLLSRKAEQRLRAKVREMTPPNWGAVHHILHTGGRRRRECLEFATTGKRNAVYKSDVLDTFHFEERAMTTGKKAASTASKKLKSGSSSKSEKSVAGSDLSQAKGGKKK